MPYKRRTPVSEKEMEGTEIVSEWEMDRTRWKGHHTICQTLRDMYQMIDNEELRLKCRLAMAMAKAMNEKLKWYKNREEAR